MNRFCDFLYKRLTIVIRISHFLKFSNKFGKKWVKNGMIFGGVQILKQS